MCRYLLGIQPQADSEDKAMTDVEWAQLSFVAAVEMASLEWLLTNQVQTDKESNSRIYFFCFETGSHVNPGWVQIQYVPRITLNS